MDKAFYLNAFRAQSAALIDAARCDLTAPIPSCPEWTMTTLVGHIGTIWAAVAKRVRASTDKDVVQDIEDFGFTPAPEKWSRSHFALEHSPPDLIDWLTAQAAALSEAFETTNPDDRTWTWFEADQTTGFWLRRMTHEAAIHRWDAQCATQDVPDDFDPTLASDGIDEALTIYVPSNCRPKSRIAGGGKSYHVHCTDTAGEWMVRFEGVGMTVSREHGKADVAIRGIASDLFLFIWHRVPLARFDVVGDEMLATRYFAFVPPD